MRKESPELHEKEFDFEAALASLKPVLEAIGKEVLAMRESKDLAVEKKGGYDANIVTRADKASEAALAAHIREHYPDHAIRGEEGTNTESESGYEWILDPIDGTFNYANGMDLFGISAALAKNGRAQMGVTYFPALKKTAWAIKNQGAWVNGERMNAGGTSKKLKDSLISVGLVKGTEHLFGELRKHSGNVLAGGSFVAEALWLTEGKIDTYIHTGATPFDIAAAQLIAEEAGCVASGIENDEIDLAKEKIPVIFAKSKDLLDEVRALVRGK